VSTEDCLIINGNRTAASDGGTVEVVDPSTGGPLATVAKATSADVSRAVAAAQAALESKAWGGILPAERGRIMQRIAQTIRGRAEELATLESRDNGKPLTQARTDVRFRSARDSSILRSGSRLACRRRSSPGTIRFRSAPAVSRQRSRRVARWCSSRRAKRR